LDFGLDKRSQSKIENPKSKIIGAWLLT